MNEADANPDERRTLQRRRFTLLIVVALVTSLGLYSVLRRGTVERRLAALRAAGYPTTFAELDEYNRIPEGVPNAADVYARAFAAFVAPADEANLPVLGSAQLPDRGAPLPEAVAKAVAEYLAVNRACLALLHEAAGLEHCRHDWDSRQGFVQASTLNACALLLELDAIAQAYGNNPTQVAARVTDGFRLGESLRKGPGLFACRVQTDCDTAALEGLERALPVAGFTDEQLRDLDQVLHAARDRADLREALIRERCLAIEYCRDPSLIGGMSRGSTFLRVPGFRRIGFLDTIDYFSAYVEAAGLPPVQRLARFRAIEAKVAGLSSVHETIKDFIPEMRGSVVLDLRRQVHFDLARAALALERYRLAQGALPECLEELTPRYLEQVPIDPFDGNPIRYRRTEPGYRLYSVLDDGQDNGGRGPDEVNGGGPYDWCFLVTR